MLILTRTAAPTLGEKRICGVWQAHQISSSRQRCVDCSAASGASGLKVTSSMQSCQSPLIKHQDTFSSPPSSELKSSLSGFLLLFWLSFFVFFRWKSIYCLILVAVTIEYVEVLEAFSVWRMYCCWCIFRFLMAPSLPIMSQQTLNH